MSTINMILAVAKNGVIGKNNDMPWKIKEDHKKFKELTMGGILFVGKKTFNSLPPLPGREVIMLSSMHYPMLTDVREIAGARNKIGWIAGGGEIYRAALDQNICDTIYLTIIDKKYEGDVYFPLKKVIKEWTKVSEEVLKDKDPLTKLQIWKRC
jgi:dihydrofolate reductase